MIYIKSLVCFVLFGVSCLPLCLTGAIANAEISQASQAPSAANIQGIKHRTFHTNSVLTDSLKRLANAPQFSMDKNILVRRSKQHLWLRITEILAEHNKSLRSSSKYGLLELFEGSIAGPFSFTGYDYGYDEFDLYGEAELKAMYPLIRGFAEWKNEIVEWYNDKRYFAKQYYEFVVVNPKTGALYHSKILVVATSRPEPSSGSCRIASQYSIAEDMAVVDKSRLADYIGTFSLCAYRPKDFRFVYGGTLPGF